MIEKPVHQEEPYHQEKPVVNGNLKYIIAIVAMIAIGVFATVVIVVLRPNGDNTATIAAIIGLVTTTTFSILAFLKAQETHQSVDGRLDSFIRSAEQASRSQGLVEGRVAGRESADARTDALAEKKMGDK